MAAFERSSFHLTEAVEALQAHHFPNTQPIEFHASWIRSHKGFWQSVNEATRRQVLQDLAQVLASTEQRLVLFAAVVEKTSELWGEEAVERATEQICTRFNIFLTRRFQTYGDAQRGLLIFAESSYKKRFRLWVTNFRELGTQWGVINNLSDIPYFGLTRQTRLLQLADFVAYAVFRLYEHQDPTLISPILQRFVQKDGTLHGLVHVREGAPDNCRECPACASRLTPWDFGSWVSILTPAVSPLVPVGATITGVLAHLATDRYTSRIGFVEAESGTYFFHETDLETGQYEKLEKSGRVVFEVLEPIGGYDYDRGEYRRGKARNVRPYTPQSKELEGEPASVVEEEEEE